MEKVKPSRILIGAAGLAGALGAMANIQLVPTTGALKAGANRCRRRGSRMAWATRGTTYRRTTERLPKLRVGDIWTGCIFSPAKRYR